VNDITHGPLARMRCQICAREMRLKKREAHPVRGPSVELQTYECRKCGMFRYREVETPAARNVEN
jgi:C4-type Zn-finger protein